MIDKKRLRNYGLWLAVSALVIDLLIYANIITVPKAEIEMFVQRFLEIMILLGIVSNPTRPDSKGFNL